MCEIIQTQQQSEAFGKLKQMAHDSTAARPFLYLHMLYILGWKSMVLKQTWHLMRLSWLLTWKTLGKLITFLSFLVS